MAAIALALVTAAPAHAADAPGWSRQAETDEITGAKVDGVVYAQGPNTLVLACSDRDGARRFVVSWRTDYHLGRSGRRAVDYRLSDGKPVREDWDYSSRGARPIPEMIFLDPARRFARRLVDSHGDRLLFRLFGRDGEAHDIAVPLDDHARGLVQQALGQCS